MTQGARPDVADVQAYFASLWALETTHKPIRFGERDSLESLHDLDSRMLGVLCAEVPDATKIMAVESAFTVPLVDQATGAVLDRDLVGTLDLVERKRRGSPRRGRPQDRRPEVIGPPSRGLAPALDLQLRGPR